MAGKSLTLCGGKNIKINEDAVGSIVGAFWPTGAVMDMYIYKIKNIGDGTFAFSYETEEANGEKRKGEGFVVISLVLNCEVNNTGFIDYVFDEKLNAVVTLV